MPRVFISYSWEDEDHKVWVRHLTDCLLEYGIDATLDQYDLTLGDRLPQFMEQAITEADYVLIICTPTYKKKSDARNGGVGYEGHIISGELFSIRNERKFIPVIRKGNMQTAIPNSLLGKLAVDLTDGPHYNANFSDLLTTLQGLKKTTPMKAKQDRVGAKQVLIDDSPIHILGIITNEVTVPQITSARGSRLYKIPLRLSRQPSSLWEKLFIGFWKEPPRYTSMHKPNIASVLGDRIILDGTTIEEVRDYHRDTLVLCVDEANQAERTILREQMRLKEQENQHNNEHLNKVQNIANDIRFE